jgi:hypothetical protein
LDRNIRVVAPVDAVDLGDLVRMLAGQSGEILDDLAAELRIVDGLAIRRRVQHDDVGVVIPCEGPVFDPRRARRLRGRVIPPAGAEVVLQPETVATESQKTGHDDADDGETQPVYQIAPACEH